MTSSRPYLVRALIEWIVDNDLTPYLALSCEVEGVDVPNAYVKDNKIVLNVSANATRDFQLGNQTVDFESRFNGVAHRISAPVGAIVAVYAKENGQGMAFEPESPNASPDPSGGADGPDSDPPPRSGSGPNLRVV